MKRQRVFWTCLAVLAMFAGINGYAQAVNRVTVVVNSPAEVEVESDFTVTLDIGEVTELNAVQYDISFDPDVLRLDNITSGLIDTTVISALYNEIRPGVYRVVQTLLTDNVSGSGYLAILHFHSFSISCSSYIGISGGILSGMHGEIPSSWTGSQVIITDEEIEEIVHIELEAGWNLVSMPYTVLSEDSAPDIMCSDILGSMRAIYEYDACAERFYSYNPDPAVPDFLPAITDGTGYWLFMDGPDVLTVYNRDSDGGVPPAYTNACTGYNLIGPRIGNQCDTLTVADWLGGKPASAVLGWNSQTHSFYTLASSSYIQPGQGYFVFFDGIAERSY